MYKHNIALPLFPKLKQVFVRLSLDCKLFPLLKNEACLSENDHMLRSQENEEKSNTGVWILDFYFWLALCELHSSHGLLESLICGWQRWQLDDQGDVVLVKPVEGLCGGHLVHH